MEDMVKQYLSMVLYSQYQWWGGEVCSHGHGGGEDVTGAWYSKGLPARTLVLERQQCTPKHKLSTERFMAMRHGNASRNHNKLVLIGKAPPPQKKQ
jgi:hypothetical protein